MANEASIPDNDCHSPAVRLSGMLALDRDIPRARQVARGLHTLNAVDCRRGWPVPIRTKRCLMNAQLIQDWTSSEVALKRGASREVRYKVFRAGDRMYQEIRDADDVPIHTLELPQGIALERRSFEVLLRYVLLNIIEES